MVVPVIVRLLLSWIAGILCADLLASLTDRSLPALVFLLLLYIGIVAMRFVARRCAASADFDTRMRAALWRGASVLVLTAALGFVRQRCAMDPAAPFTAEATDRQTSWLLPEGTIRSVRSWCLSCIDSHGADAEVRGLVQGCLLGDRSGASRRTILDFNRAGMGHLLAVSGLHMGFITLLIGLLLAPLRLLPHGQVVTRLGALLLMWTYVVLIGSPPSAVRAAVMLSMFLGAWILRRHVDAWHNLGVAALLLLVYDPRLLYHVSFQMSFLAAATIIFLSSRLPGVETDERHPSWSPWVWVRRAGRTLLFTVLLQAAMMPLMIHYFHRVTVMGCLQAFLVLPLLGVDLSLIVGCLLCHALGAWLPTFGALFASCAQGCWLGVDGCSRWMMAVAAWCRAADVRLFGDVSWSLSLASTLGCYAVCLTLYLGYRLRRPSWWAVAGVVLLGWALR